MQWLCMGLLAAAQCAYAAAPAAIPDQTALIVDQANALDEGALDEEEEDDED